MQKFQAFLMMCLGEFRGSAGNKSVRASSIADIATIGRPSILVPLKSAIEMSSL